MSFDSTKVVSTDYLKAVAAWTTMELQRLQSSKPSLGTLDINTVFPKLDSNGKKMHMSMRSKSLMTTNITAEKLHKNLNEHCDTHDLNVTKKNLIKKTSDNKGGSKNQLNLKNSLQNANKSKNNICSLSSNNKKKEKSYKKNKANFSLLNQKYFKSEKGNDVKYEGEILLPVELPKVLSNVIHPSVIIYSSFDHIRNDKHRPISKLKHDIENPENITLRYGEKVKIFPCSPRPSLAKCLNPVVSILPMSKETQSAISINPKPNKFSMSKSKNTFEYKYPYTSSEEESENNFASNCNGSAYIEEKSECSEFAFENKVDFASDTEFVDLHDIDIFNSANENHYHLSVPKEDFDLTKFTTRLERRLEEVFNPFPIQAQDTTNMLQKKKLKNQQFKMQDNFSQTSCINIGDKPSSTENCFKINKKAGTSLVLYEDKAAGIFNIVGSVPSHSKEIITPQIDVSTSTFSSIKSKFETSIVNQNSNNLCESSIEYNSQKSIDENGTVNLVKSINEGFNDVITNEGMKESKMECYNFPIQKEQETLSNISLNAYSPEMDIAEPLSLNDAPPLNEIRTLLPSIIQVPNLDRDPSPSPIISSLCPPKNLSCISSCKINAPTPDNSQSQDLSCAVPACATMELASNNIPVLDLNSTSLRKISSIPHDVQSLNLNCDPSCLSKALSLDNVNVMESTCATSSAIRAQSPESPLDLNCASSHPVSVLSILSEMSSSSIDKPNLTDVNTIDEPNSIDTNETLNKMLVGIQPAEGVPVVRSNEKEVNQPLTTDNVNQSLFIEVNSPAAEAVKQTPKKLEKEETTLNELDITTLACSDLVSLNSSVSYTMGNPSNTQISSGEIFLPSFEIGDVTISEGEIEFEASLTTDIPLHHISITVAPKDSKPVTWSNTSTQTDFDNKVTFLDEEVCDIKSLNTESIAVGETVSSGEIILDPDNIRKLPYRPTAEIEQLMEENLKLRNKLSCFSGRFCLGYVRDTG